MQLKSLKSWVGGGGVVVQGRDTAVLNTHQQKVSAS